MNFLKIFIIILLFIILIISIINFFRKDSFKNKIKKDIIIFSSGPTLNEIKNYLHIFTPEFYNKFYIVGIKDSALFLDKLGVKVDYFLYSHAGYKTEYDEYIFKNSPNIIKNCSYLYSKNNKYLNIIFKIVNFFKMGYNNKHNIKYIDVPVIDRSDNIMNCVVKNKKKCFNYNINKGIAYYNDGHIMCDQAIPLGIELKCNNIYCLGWDLCENAKGQNDYSYFNKNIKEKFADKSNLFKNDSYSIFNFEKIREFTKYLPKYLKEHYKINIFRLSKNQCVNLPLFDINKL